jgi:hypothetical protein
MTHTVMRKKDPKNEDKRGGGRKHGYEYLH